MGPQRRYIEHSLLPEGEPAIGSALMEFTKKLMSDSYVWPQSSRTPRFSGVRSSASVNNVAARALTWGGWT